MMFRQIQLLCGTLVLGLQIATSCFAQIHVFGDSLSETGNFSILTGGSWPPAPLYYYGRFSNGPIWVEYIADALDEAIPQPFLLGGTNYAVNGARAAGPSPYYTPDLAGQVANYLVSNYPAANGDQADANEIFVIWAGANDIFFGALGDEADFIPNAVEGIAGAIRTLHDAGARTFIVPNLPLLGQTPFFNTNATVSSELDWASEAFNSQLSKELRSLRKEFRHVKIADVDIAHLFKSMTRKPKRFELTNVVDSATLFEPFSGIGYALAPDVDPEKYLFWDSVHPTTHGHRIIADYVLADIKVKSTNR